MAINYVSKFSDGSGNSSFDELDSGDQSYASGRRLIVLTQAEKNGHTNGFGTDWAVTDDATTNDLTWTREAILTETLQGAAFACESQLWYSSELTDAETFTVNSDPDDTSTNDTYFISLQILEVENWDGTFDQVNSEFVEADNGDVTYSPAPSSGDQQLQFSAFQNDAVISSWDTVALGFTVNSGSENDGPGAARSFISTTNTTATISDGYSGGGTTYNCHRWGLILNEAVATTPEGSATFDADASIAAAGSRPSQGTATFSADASIAAVGDAPIAAAEGTATFGADASIAGVGFAPGTATVSGTVTHGPDLVQGIQVDRYTDDAGSRGDFIGSTTTDVNGDYSFTVSAPVTEWLTFIAPVGQTWVQSGTQFWDVQYSVIVSEVEDIDAQLTPNVATLGANASISGLGTASAQGGATLNAEASISAATGARPSQGGATFNASGAIVAVGDSPPVASEGQATFNANASISAAGSRLSLGAATFDANASISGFGARASLGSSVIGADASIYAEGNDQTTSVRVQRGDVVVSADGQTYTLSRPAPLGHSFVVISNNRMTTAGDPTNGPPSPVNQDGDDMGVFARLTDPFTITFGRTAVTPEWDAFVAFEVWTYVGPTGGANEFVVRSRDELNLTNVNTQAATLATVPTSIDDCIPFVQGAHTSGDGNDADHMAIIAYLSGPDKVNVDIGPLTSATVQCHVTTVEFIGSNWSIGHGRLNGQSTDSGTIPLVTAAAGTGGSSFDVTDWATAAIASWGHTSLEVGIADLWPILEPGATNTDVDYTFNPDHDGTDDDFIVHVMRHPDLAVTRFDDFGFGLIRLSIDITSAALSSMEKSSILGTTITSGTGASYGRGWRTYRINSLTEAEHFCHRSGLTETHRIQVIDWTAVADVITTPPAQGTATFSATASITAVGDSPALAPEGQATFNATASIAAVGSRPSQGTAKFDADASITATGARASSGAALPFLNFAVIDAEGSVPATTPEGQATLNANASISGFGSAPALGAATIGATASITAAGLRSSLGSATYNATATIFGASFTQVVDVVYAARRIARHGAEAVKRHGALPMRRHRARRRDR